MNIRKQQIYIWHCIYDYCYTVCCLFVCYCSLMLIIAVIVCCWPDQNEPGEGARKSNTRTQPDCLIFN